MFQSLEKYIFRHVGDDHSDDHHNFQIDGRHSEKVKQWSHLGNMIDFSQQDEDRIFFGRNTIIGQIDDTSFKSLLCGL